MISNNRISNLVNTQVPFFVRNDHQNFVVFLEKYYEYLEQNNKLVNTLKNIQNYQNIDLTEDQYAERLYSTFMRFFPKNTYADKKMILKNIKDFYRSRGTEKSIRFLLSAIYNVQEIEIYYPKKDILRASDGKWYIQRSIRIDDIRIDGQLVETDDPLILERFVGIKVTAQTTGTTALVERVDRFYEETSLIKELIVSNIDGRFKNSEVITGVYSDGENFHDISAVVYNFVIDELDIINQGTFYKVGDPVIIKSNTGNGAIVTVGSVTNGEIISIDVIDGGAGYQAGDDLKFIGLTYEGGPIAVANVLTINSDGSVHPNTYLLDDTLISIAKDDIIGNVNPYETYSYANLATIFETREPATSNLVVYSSNITSISEYTNRLFRSNVRIANNGLIVVNSQYTIISTYNTTNDHITVDPGFVGNVSGYTIEPVTIRNWTNLYVNVESGIADTNGISLLKEILVQNASNLIITSVDTSNTLVLSSNVANSNVYITVGTKLVANGSNLTVTSVKPGRGDWITTTPALRGTIDNNHIMVYQSEYIRANVEDCNVFFGVGNVISINQVNTFVTISDSPTSNVINVYPRIPINSSTGLTLDPLRIFTSVPNTSNIDITNAYSDTVTLNEMARNSNVYFRAGDYLEVNGALYLVDSYSTSTNSIVLLPGLRDSVTTFEPIVVHRTPFNATSNLTLSTGGGGYPVTLSGIKSTSNVFFETGDGLRVDNDIVTILSSNSETDAITVYPPLAGGMSGKWFDVVKKPNVNTIIANSLIYFSYSPTGPVTSVRLISGGSYLKTPTIQVEGNNKIFQYGILGSLNIANPGFGYTVGDLITFNNVPGGFGTGALAEVYNVDSSGAITQVKFKEVEGQTIGGSGYDINFLPTANIQSATGYDGVIEVKNILGSGARFQARSNKVGGIRSLIVRSRGSGYEDAYADLTANGDGAAVVNVSVVAGDIFGVYAYPGRWLGDDGQISSANYLQDRDYYQTFSYVIKTDTSINKYRKAVKDLVHPAGTSLFGEHMSKDQPSNTACPCEVTTKQTSNIRFTTYNVTTDNVMIKLNGHGLEVGNTVTLEFLSGNIANYSAASVTYGPNNIFKVSEVIDGDNFSTYLTKNLPAISDIFTLTGESEIAGIYMRYDGKMIYTTGSSEDRVYQLDLEVPYDISSIRYNTVSDILTTQPYGLDFDPSGMYMYIADLDSDNVAQYQLSESWNVNTATYVTSFNVSASVEETSLSGVKIKPDGNTMYVVGYTNDTVYQYSLGTKWNVSTANLVTTFSLLPKTGSPHDIFFKYDGTKMYVSENQKDSILEYDLTVAWNVNTAIYKHSSANVRTLLGENDALAVHISDDGKVLYIAGSYTDSIIQMPMLEAWNVNTAFYETSTTGNVLVGKIII